MRSPVLAGSFCLLLIFALCSAVLAQPFPITERGLLPGDWTIGPAVNTQQEQSVAPGGGQYLAVWLDLRGQAVDGGTNQSGGDVFGVRLDAQVGPPRPHDGWSDRIVRSMGA